MYQAYFPEGTSPFATYKRHRILSTGPSITIPFLYIHEHLQAVTEYVHVIFLYISKCTAIPVQTLRVQRVETIRFQDNRQMKVIGLSTIGTGRLYPPGNIPGTHF